MNSSNLKIRYSSIAIILILLVVVRIFISGASYQQTNRHTVDEEVFQLLSDGLIANFPQYHIIKYGLMLKAAGRQVPEYFFRPIFKHPPVFPVLGVLSKKIIHHQHAMLYLAALMGALTIPFVFFLTSILSNYKWGILAAVLVSIDPIIMISSQKVWSDTTLTLLSFATLTFYLAGLKYQKRYLLLLAALAAGFAVLTKYTGILPWFVISLHIFVSGNEVFKSKIYRFFLAAIPAIMFLPWIVVNYLVYRSKFWRLFEYHVNSADFLHDPFAILMPVVTGLLILLPLCFLLYAYSRKPLLIVWTEFKEIISAVGCLGLVVLLLPHIVKFFNPGSYPGVYWKMFSFAEEPLWFYLGRITEYSLFAGIGFFALLTLSHRNELVPLLKYVTLITIFFFIAWGNFQCRYILPAVPFLYVLAALSIQSIWQGISQLDNRNLKTTLQTGLVIIILWSVVKTTLININISFPNDLAYF